LRLTLKIGARVRESQYDFRNAVNYLFYGRWRLRGVVGCCLSTEQTERSVIHNGIKTKINRIIQ
jgi:hypothetical protein